jgi:hypothetical protein
MPEHVIGVRRATGDRSLLDAVDLIREVSGVREADYGESVAALALLRSLRDELALGDVVTYHVCDHDSGQGNCAASVTEL